MIADVLSTPLLAAGGSNAALVTFLVYTLCVFGLAALANRLLHKKSFLSEYFLGSRSLGVWAFALTFAATSASGGSFTGFPSKVYAHGWILGLWIGSYLVVPICAMGLLGKRINQVARLSGAITVPDVLRDRFRSAYFGLIAVSLIVFFMSFNLVAQFKAGSEILSTLLQDVQAFRVSVGWVAHAQESTGLFEKVDPAHLLCLSVFAVAVILYTTWGGFHAVVWTDVMQGIVMVFGVMILLPLALYQVGGLGNATAQMARMTPPRLGLAQFDFDVPAAADFSMNSPWFALPGEDGSRPRLFRVNKTFAVPRNQATVEHVRFVEITTPEEIDAQLERLRQPGAVRQFNAGMRRLKERQILWLERADDLSAAERAEAIEKLRREIENLDDNSIALLNSPDLNGIEVIVTLSREYAYGAGKQGMYVTGPGPDPPSLPGNPGTLAVELDTEADLRVLDSEGRVYETRRDGPGRVLIALEAGREYRLEVQTPDAPVWTVPVAVNAGTVETLETSRLDANDEADRSTTGDARPQAESSSGLARFFERIKLLFAPESRSAGFLPLSLAVSFFFMWAISGAGQPSAMVRLMAFNNSTTLRRSIFTVAVYYSLIYFPLVIVFCCARVLLPGMDLESDRIMPQLAVTLTSNVGHAWLAGLLVAAPFAAVMSTVDSFLLMISSALVRDIYQRNMNPEAQEKTLKRLSYFFTLVVGVGAMLGAINPPQFLQDIIVYTGSGLAACFLAPMVFALYWPRTNATGAIAGMLAGFLAHLAMYCAGMVVHGSFFKPYQLFNFDPIIVGLLVSFVTVYVVTKLTPPPPEDLVRKYFYKTK